MSNKSWSREDVVQWLKECGCEEEKFSINDEGMYETSYDPETLYRHAHRLTQRLLILFAKIHIPHCKL